MHALTGWFIRNPVAANLVMVLILFLGVQTALSIRIEGFPRIPAETIQINTYFPNATAAQIDEQLTARIERALEGLDGVRSVASQSGNGVSAVEVRKTPAKDLNELLDAVRIRMDAIGDFPATAERPVIEAAPFDLPALYVNLHGSEDLRTQQRLARRLREALLEQPELSRIKAWGLIPREVRVTLDPLRLQALDLTVDDVVARIQAGSLDYPAGSLRTRGGTIYLRADSKARFGADLAPIPIMARRDGRDVRLGDIADIEEAFHTGDFVFRLNGTPTVGMEVLVGRKENLLTISRVVHATIDAFATQLPPDVKVTVWGDASEYIAERLQLLQKNGVQGLLLVVLILSLFLNVRLAFWVAMGIPVSVLGALAVGGSAWIDYSLNDVTTFGLIIALGILVDDAVVVGESVFEARADNPDPIIGTQDGVDRVATATIFGVATTIAAFFPMLMIDNQLGKVLAGFSGIVILALMFSLFESKFILPAHLAALTLDRQARSRPAQLWARVQGVAQRGLHRFRDGPYRHSLQLALAHRYAVLVLFLALGVTGIGLIAKGKIRSVFFPDVPGQIITVSLQMDSRAPMRLTQANLNHIEGVGHDLNLRYQQAHGLDAAPIQTMFYLISDPETAVLYAELTPSTGRKSLPVAQIVRDWRAEVGQLEGAVELEITGAESLAGGFEFRLFGKNREELRAASAELRTYLAGISGLSNLRDSLSGGRPEFTIRLKAEALGLGITPESLARQLGAGFGGAEAQRIRRDGQEIKVIVQLQDSARDTVGDLMSARIRSDSGAWLPLPSVATIAGGYVPGAVARFNGKLVNRVAASVDRDIAAPEEIAHAVFEELAPRLAQRYPTVELRGGGELEEIGEIQGGLLRALALATVLIYVLMAVPLKSYVQPLLILAIIPFGFIGAAAGHLLMGLPLSVLSFFGMLALAGVVVNDSLVLLTRYRQTRERGLAPLAAVEEAAISRFRAIFLTTATTVIGLLPLLSETSEQAQYLIPAAVSLAFGELFATALMLILVPVLVLVFEDISGNETSRGDEFARDIQR